MFCPRRKSQQPGRGIGMTTVPLVTSQRTLVLPSFLTNTAVRDTVLLENFIKGKVFFVFFGMQSLLWIDAVVIFLCFHASAPPQRAILCPRSDSLPLKDHPFVAALTQASHSLQSAAVSSALSPTIMSEWTTNATRGWCLSGQSCRGAALTSLRLPEHSYTLHTVGTPADLFCAVGVGKVPEVAAKTKTGFFEGNDWNWNGVRGAHTQTVHCSSRSKGRGGIQKRHSWSAMWPLFFPFLNCTSSCGHLPIERLTSTKYSQSRFIMAVNGPNLPLVWFSCQRHKATALKGPVPCRIHHHCAFRQDLWSLACRWPPRPTGHMYSFLLFCV